MTRFGMNYVDYWKERGKNLGKDAPAPTEGVPRSYIGDLPISADTEVLDVGCGYGRLAKILTARSSRVDGMEVDATVVQQVRADGLYRRVLQCGAEAIAAEEASYDAVICWAVFDFLEQERSLVEMHRVLRPGGCLLLTGKNHDYDDDDHLAWVAELKVRQKGYPHSFTRVGDLLADLTQLGFAVRLAHGFERRGDFARMTHRDLLAAGTAGAFYEYCLVLEKTGPWRAAPDWRVSEHFSQVTQKRAGTSDEASLNAFVLDEAQRLQE